MYIIKYTGWQVFVMDALVYKVQTAAFSSHAVVLQNLIVIL